jgi:murein DD-endopeptidase MepM/ murein hydrolase activator NlpD
MPDPASIRAPNSFGKRREGALLTISRNGRERRIRIRPFWLASIASLVLVFFAGHMAATAYLVFRDDLIGAAQRHRAARQLEYEDRIATLRANLDRVLGRQMIDQQAIEAKLAELNERQELLAGRDGALGRLLEEAARRGIGTRGGRAPDKGASLDPVRTGGTFATFALRGSADLSGAGHTDLVKTGPAVSIVATKADAGQARIASSIAAIEAGQKESLAALRNAALRQADTMAAAIAELSPEIAATASTEVGGPYLPLDLSASFEIHVDALQTSLARIDRLRARLDGLPLGHPAPGQEMTSGFGARLDPFLGSMAMHGGVDFRAAAGTPVPAAAAGKVIEAGNSGGYGNMVEIAHAGGYSTRYGHLSEIRVKAGEEIRAGDVIGLSGSTGRSTGPHIHYEVRKDGSPVDPVRFIKAGRLLAGAAS